MRVLGRAFYERDALEVAPELLNKVLLVRHPDGPDALAVRIVEVEAYRGTDDPASHAFRGRSARNATMFGPPGHLYVYFTYGMHHCMNVVCAQPGTAQAVLLRAGAPLAGVEAMHAARTRGPRRLAAHQLCNGPAKLCQAFGITRAHDGMAVLEHRRTQEATGERPAIAVADDGTPPPLEPGVSPRIGITTGTEHRWRWFVPADPNVSGRATIRPPG